MRGLKLTILLLSMLTMMAAAIIAPSLPDIAVAFKDTPHIELLAKLILSIPALMIALIAPFVGKFIDSFGRLKLLYAGLVIYAVSGTSAYLIDDIYLILLSRMFLGIGISIIMTIAVTLVGDYFEGKERQKFIGYQSAFIGIAGVFFMSLGGYLATLHWRMPFLIYLFSLFLIPMSFFFLKESKPSLVSTKSIPNYSPLLKILFPIGTLFMVLFYLIPTQLPFLLKSAGINIPSYSGNALAINALGIVCSSLLYSKFKQSFSFLSMAWLGLLLMGLGYALTANASSFSLFLATVFIAGLGLGLFIANLNFWVLEISPAEIRGKTMGILTASLFLGQFSSPILAQPIVSQLGLPFLFMSSSIVMLIMGVSLSHVSKQAKKSHSA